MRLPRVRFTIWRMMLAVALMAFAIFGSQTARRWLHYREEYRANAHFESLAREQSLRLREMGFCAYARPNERVIRIMEAEEARWQLQLIDHFRKLREQYALAMGRPWLPVPPDPPVPE